MPTRRDTASKLSQGNSGYSNHNSSTIIRAIVPNEEIGKCLKKIPLLAHLNKFEREKLGGALVEESFSQGKAVFNEGDPGETFYIIKEGVATVWQKTPNLDSTMMLSKLTAGDYFGEQSILTSLPRSASVVAETFLVCYVLESPKFIALFKKDRLDITFAKRRRIAINAEVPAESSEHAGQSSSASSSSSSSSNPDSSRRLSGDPANPFPSELPRASMSDETRALLLLAIHQSVLFHHMEMEHKERAASVMYQRCVDKGAKIIVEGEEGDAFYVIEEGNFDVYQVDKESGENVKVDEHGPGAAIGELALMYNAPRNATCIATTPAKVRVLERRHFNKIVRDIGEQRLDQYSKWLGKIELLAPLTNLERDKIAEALEVQDYEDGTPVYKQGEAAKSLFIIVSGEIVITRRNDATKEMEEIGRCHHGEYFGERALIHNTARAATATTVGATRCLKLDRSAFVLLLGALEDMLRKKVPADEGSTCVAPWQAEDIAFADLHPIGILGKGSYGFVELVHHPPTGRQFALKTVSKQRVVQTHQKAHVLDEKNIMCQLDHPFLTKLHATYKDQNCLYFLLEPSLGGEMFTILRRCRLFPEEHARFYAAQLVLALEYMHTRNFVYRDLKPENLLLDTHGYAKLVDFGFVKCVKHKTWTMCGTPEYLAPEVIASKGHGKGVDWWTLGVFLFEMLASYTPFYGHGDDLKMYDRICNGKFKFPSHFSQDVKSLLQGLLQIQPTKRLGVIQGGADNVKLHRWFKDFDWQALLWKKLVPPLKVGNPREVNQDETLRQIKILPYEDDGTKWDADF